MVPGREFGPRKPELVLLSSQQPGSRSSSSRILAQPHWSQALSHMQLLQQEDLSLLRNGLIRKVN